MKKTKKKNLKKIAIPEMTNQEMELNVVKEQITLLSSQSDEKTVIKVVRDNVTGNRYMIVEHTHGATAIQPL